MPWKLQKTGDKYNVVKKDGGRVVGRSLSKARAAAMLRALYANEPTMNADGYPKDVDMKVAKRVDLIVLPVAGTNCGNCRWFDAKEGYCENKKVKQPVTDKMCCSLWDNDKVKRPWGKMVVNEEQTSNGYPLYGSKTCPNCGARMPRMAKECPNCGYKRVVTNTWSDAARLAARAAERHGYKHIHSSMSREGSQEHHFKKGAYHTVTINENAGTWVHTANLRHNELGRGESYQLANHLKAIHGGSTKNMKATTRNMISNAIMPRKAFVAKAKGVCPKCGGKMAGGKCKGCGMTMNVWSEAARAAAKEKRAGRHAAIHELLTQKKFKPAGKSTYTSYYQRKTKEGGTHQIDVDKETGQWSHRRLIGSGARVGGGTGHRSLAAHLKSQGLK